MDMFDTMSHFVSITAVVDNSWTLFLAPSILTTALQKAGNLNCLYCDKTVCLYCDKIKENSVPRTLYCFYNVDQPICGNVILCIVFIMFLNKQRFIKQHKKRQR